MKLSARPAPTPPLAGSEEAPGVTGPLSGSGRECRTMHGPGQQGVSKGPPAPSIRMHILGTSGKVPQVPHDPHGLTRLSPDDNLDGET